MDDMTQHVQHSSAQPVTHRAIVHAQDDAIMAIERAMSGRDDYPVTIYRAEGGYTADGYVGTTVEARVHASGNRAVTIGRAQMTGEIVSSVAVPVENIPALIRQLQETLFAFDGAALGEANVMEARQYAAGQAG